MEIKDVAVFFMLVSSCLLPIAESQSYRQKEPMTPEQICQQFTKGNSGFNEFYTPMYPNKYPNKTDCMFKISAEYGFLIRVDFRDYFDLEPSENCENDFLEIRDGPHGYADLMGRFCGNEFPPIITSKDRHLWLRFSSDDSLEYKGFRAVYEFIQNSQIDRPEIRECTFELSGKSQGMISNIDIPQFRVNYSITYTVPLDCTWYIEVNPNEKIYLFFEEFKLDQPNDCVKNYVDIFGSQRDLRSRLKHYCGSVADPLVTHGSKMYFRFFALPGALNTEFKAWYTAYRDRMQDKSTHCEPHEYDCDDATCIDKSLECNGIKNCRHEYDEEGCNANTKKKFDISSEHIIIILTLGCGLLAGMCFAMCFNCIKKLIRDGRQIHENIRRSREQLEERRSTSMGSSPQLLRSGTIVDEEAESGKKNGHTCVEDEDETEEEDTEDEEEDESCVEMRDCECQTRDSIASHQSGLNGTPPPPPPPMRRPPNPPNSPPLSVPTPPPPPGYYRHHHGEIYGGASSYAPRGVPPHSHSRHSDHYEAEDSCSSDPYKGGSVGSDPYKAGSVGSDPYKGGSGVSDTYKSKHRAEAMIQMRGNRYEPNSPKTEKSTPDVLVTH